LIESSCASVNSSDVLSRFFIQLNTGRGDKNDLQAEQAVKGNHAASTTMVR
tara:strand:+ start:91 stop:243 length:153 start_codon:yes stop_codon:yes gene_type:complete